MTTQLDEYIHRNLEEIPTLNYFILNYPNDDYHPQSLISTSHLIEGTTAEPILGFYSQSLTRSVHVYPLSNKVAIENWDTAIVATHTIPTVNSLLHLIIAMNKVITKQIKIDSL